MSLLAVRMWDFSLSLGGGGVGGGEVYFANSIAWRNRRKLESQEHYDSSYA